MQFGTTKGELATQRGCEFEETYWQDSRAPTKKNSTLCSMFIDQGGDIAVTRGLHNFSREQLVTVHKIEWILILQCATSHDY